MTEKWQDRLALASLITGLTSLLCVLVPACGVVVALAAFIMGALTIRGNKRIHSVIGMVTSMLAIVGCIIHMFVTLEMIQRGDHPWVAPYQQQAAPE